MTIPKITPYSGGIANPDGSQTQTEFTQNMFDQLSYEAQLATELNTTVDGINDTATQVDTNATNAAQSASDAQSAADSVAGTQFVRSRIGNISDYAGDTLTYAERFNIYQFPDDSGDWYGVNEDETFPITIPADPTAPSSGWSLVNGASQKWVEDNYTPTYEFEEKNEEQDTRLNDIESIIDAHGSRITNSENRISANESDILALQSGQGSSVIGYATQSGLYADLNHDDKSIGYVTNDPVVTNNGTYRKEGASGSGSWVQSNADLPSLAYQLATQNESLLESIDGIQYNLVGGDLTEGLVDIADGRIYSPNGTWSYNLSKVTGGSVVSIETTLSSNAGNAWYDEDMVFLGSNQEQSGSFTLPSNARFLAVSCRSLASALDDFNCKLNGGYNIEKLVRTLEQHPATTNTDKVSAITVSEPESTLTELLDKMLQINTTLSSTVRENTSTIDELTDDKEPYFIDPTVLFKGTVNISSDEVVLTPSRISDTSFSLSDDDAALLSASAYRGVAVSDGAYVNKTVQLLSITSDNGVTTYTSSESLPEPLVSVSPIGQGNSGQHLSRIGQKAYAELVADELTKYNYKKQSLIDYNPSYLKSINYNNPSAYSVISDELLYEWVKIGGATGGGFVEGTSGLARKIAITSQININSDTYSRPLGKCHQLIQGVAGQGLELSRSLGGVDGFFSATLSAVADEYDTTEVTNGSGTLVVYADGVEVNRTVVTPPEYKEINFDIENVNELKVQWFINDSVPTSLSLGSMFFYPKSLKQKPEPIIKDGDVVAVFADSWGAFPSLEGGETSITRPDGSELGGLAYMSEHMRGYLASKGVKISTPNMSRGGQTSEWARYWVDSITELTPKPTHCIVHFSINDRNSKPYYENSSASSYDFDPIDQWQQMDSDNGGVFGSVNNKRWFDNMRFIVSRLVNAGIKPIVLLPPYTSASNQSQDLQRYFKAPMYSGFKDNFWEFSGERNTPDK